MKKSEGANSLVVLQRTISHTLSATLQVWPVFIVRHKEPEYHSIHISPRRNWDSPTLSSTSECAPPPREPKGGHTRLCVRSEKKRRLEKKVCTLPTLCFLTSRRKEEVIAFISFSTYLLQDSGISLVHPPRGLLEAVGGGGEARNRVGMGLSHRPAGLPVHRLAESIPGLHKILKMPSQSRTVCSAGGGVQCTVYYHYSEPTKLL